MPESNRQLAAIMFTDIVGYTAMMEANEASTLEIRRKNRQIHQKLIKANNGKWLKEMGDGTMAMFTTITDAVKCAIEIYQQGKDELGIELKIGIHLGEIGIEDDDIFGSGINVASRIHDLAKGGGILVSEPIYKEIRNKEGINTSFAGRTKLKNVDGYANIYQVYSADHQAHKIKIKDNKRRNWLAGIATVAVVLASILSVMYFQGFFAKPVIERSIAVLPIQSLAEDEESNAFVRSLTYDIYSRMTKIKNIDLLIDNQSVQQYGDTELTSAAIARELGVRYLLNVNSPITNKNNRVFVELIDTESSRSIWSGEYSGALLDIVHQVPNIVTQVTKRLDIALSNLEKQDINKTGTDSQPAYDAYLEGKKYIDAFYVRNLEVDLDLAGEKFKEAIAYDPEYEAAQWELSGVYYERQSIFRLGWHWLDSMDKITDHLLEINPRSAEAHRDKHMYYWYAAARARRNSKELFDSYLALAKQELALANEAAPHMYVDSDIAILYFLEEKFDSALYFMKKGLRSNPNDADIIQKTALYYMTLEEYDKAEAYFLDLLNKQPDHVISLLWLCDLYLYTDNYPELARRSQQLYALNPVRGYSVRTRSLILSNELDKAKAMIAYEISKETKPIRPLMKKFYYAYILQEQGDIDKAKKLNVENLDYIINSRDSNPYLLATVYAINKEREKSIQNIIASFATDELWLYELLQLYPWFKDILDDDRIVALMNDARQRLQVMNANFVRMEVSDELNRSRRL